MAETGNPSNTIYVGGLPAEATSDRLRDAFIPFGDIASVMLPKADESNTKDAHRGFALIEFEHATDALDAVDNMDQSEMFGRVIRVSAAKPQRDQDEGLGSRTALWNQESWIQENVVGEELAEEPEKEAEQPLDESDIAGPKQA